MRMFLARPPLLSHSPAHARAASPWLVLLAALLWLSLPFGAAHAVVIENGNGNTSTPADDPGWGHVANMGLTAVYVGSGWILTANHVGVLPVLFNNGDVAQVVAGSKTRLTSVSGTGQPDLAMHKIYPWPSLPALDLRSTPPSVGDEVVLIGRGRNQGASTQWFGISGWLWAGPSTMRWGTNQVDAVGQDLDTGLGETRSFITIFDLPGPTAYEAQGSLGDSGGPVFLKNGPTWELAGIMHAIGTFPGQPDAALEGNESWIADVASYRSQILAIMAIPGCADGWDEDGDGLSDFPADPGCDSATDPSEDTPLLQCDNGIDDDGDGLVDLPEDPTCTTFEWVESTACSDGLDNDLDGFADWDGAGIGAPDPNCAGPAQLLESTTLCGLGFEIGLLLPVVMAVRRRPERARRGSPGVLQSGHGP